MERKRKMGRQRQRVRGGWGWRRLRSLVWDGGWGQVARVEGCGERAVLLLRNERARAVCRDGRGRKGRGGVRVSRRGSVTGSVQGRGRRWSGSLVFLVPRTRLTALSRGFMRGAVLILFVAVRVLEHHHPKDKEEGEEEVKGIRKEAMAQNQDPETGETVQRHAAEAQHLTQITVQSSCERPRKGRVVVEMEANMEEEVQEEEEEKCSC